MRKWWGIVLHWFTRWFWERKRVTGMLNEDYTVYVLPPHLWSQTSKILLKRSVHESMRLKILINGLRLYRRVLILAS